MYLKIKHMIRLTILFSYALLVVSYCFFPSSELNQLLSTKIFLAHFYAFPVLFGGIILVWSVLMTLVMFYWKKRPIRALYWGIVVAVSVGLVCFGNEPTKVNQKPLDGKTIKLVEWNVADNLNANHIDEIFKHFDADIAIFPELEGYKKADMSHERLRDLFDEAHLNFDDYDAFISEPTEGAIGPVTVVIKKAFGRYEKLQDLPMTFFGTVYLKASNQQLPDIIALHTAPPLPGLMEIWRSDLNLITDELVRKNPHAIIAGDFNATMRHGALSKIGTHEDALNYLAPLARGTWNQNLSRIFQTPIDHILVPANEYGIKRMYIKDLKSSDHLCVFAEVQMIRK